MVFSLARLRSEPTHGCGDQARQGQPNQVYQQQKKHTVAATKSSESVKEIKLKSQILEQKSPQMGGKAKGLEHD